MEMQFTGFTDKENTPIYFGDVLINEQNKAFQVYPDDLLHVVITDPTLNTVEQLTAYTTKLLTLFHPEDFYPPYPL